MTADEIKDQPIMVAINPLEFTAANKLLNPNQKISEKDILQYLTGYTMIPEIKNFIKNFEAIHENIPKAFAIPMEAQINTKLIQPLRHAAGSFMLGNYLDTIAMCGFVTEMITNFLYEISDIKINEQKISSVEKQLFGRNYEKLGQDRRLQILKGFSIIDDTTHEKFEKTRQLRAKYLHGFSKDHKQIAPEAKEIFNSTLDLLILIFGQHIKDGKIYYNPNIIKYLKEKGILK